jgi:hypothetical protein
MLRKALAVICAGADCCYWRFAEGRLGGVASGGVNDYAQLWFCFEVGLGGLWGFTLKDVL